MIWKKKINSGKLLQAKKHNFALGKNFGATQRSRWIHFGIQTIINTAETQIMLYNHIVSEENHTCMTKNLTSVINNKK